MVKIIIFLLASIMIPLFSWHWFYSFHCGASLPAHMPLGLGLKIRVLAQRRSKLTQISEEIRLNKDYLCVRWCKKLFKCCFKWWKRLVKKYHSVNFSLIFLLAETSYFCRLLILMKSVWRWSLFAVNTLKRFWCKTKKVIKEELFSNCNSMHIIHNTQHTQRAHLSSDLTGWFKEILNVPFSCRLTWAKVTEGRACSPNCRLMDRSGCLDKQL